MATSSNLNANFPQASEPPVMIDPKTGKVTWSMTWYRFFVNQFQRTGGTIGNNGVGPVGPAGPAGPQGNPGTAGVAYEMDDDSDTFDMFAESLSAQNPINGSNIWLNSLMLVQSLIQSVPSDVSAPVPTIVSATTISPTTPIIFVSGTGLIETITPPPNIVNSGQITIIPTGIFTTGITGNIALSSTAVISRVLVMVYESVSGKWYPSY